MFLNKHSGPSRWGWAFLLIALALAAGLRLWQLGDWPPGLYRDEAFNGLDALNVLAGDPAFFFTANNGREPAYITLTALAVAGVGRTVTAVRLTAALAGTLTTLLVFLLGRSWFNARTGLWAAWLWAATLWTIHLSRVGLRPILLVPCLTLAFWLGTAAYRRQQRRLWLLAGLAYGLGFYTYLAIRFTPILLGLVLVYLLWQRGRQRLWPGVAWFALGTAVILLPLALFYTQNPDLLLGRAGQVSIFNQTINQGDFLGTLLRHTGRTWGMFFWRGDTILRHNPAGRPVFDLLIAFPFLIGLACCLRRWRRPAAAVTLLWVGTMLGVTILAEDAPHFLRAVGILPAALFLPAVGLDQIWQWPRLPRWLRQGMVLGLLAASLLLTVRDYRAYGRDPETGLMFEAAATELAAQIQAESDETAVYVDRWFWDESTQKGWPALPFLAYLENVIFYRPEFGLPPGIPGQSVSVYAWQFGDLGFIPQLMPPPAWVTVETGPLARGDLETESYPLYRRYASQPLPADLPPPVNFDDQMWLRDTAVSQSDPATLLVDLAWEGGADVNPNLVAFVQIVGADGVIAQQDLPPGGGLWAADWWRPGLVVQEQRQLSLPAPFDPNSQRIIVGLYDPVTAVRLPVKAEDGTVLGDSWQVAGEE